MSTSPQRHTNMLTMTHDTTTSRPEDSLRINPESQIESNSQTLSHRTMFLQLSINEDMQATSSDNGPNGRKTLFSVQEYDQYVRTLRYWNDKLGHTDPISGRHVSQKQFRKSHNHSWYQTVKIFRIATLTTNEGNQVETLIRKDKKTGRWKIVVNVDSVFDAILECHGTDHHRNIKKTKQLADEKFWNISERLCKNFIKTCPSCNNRRRKMSQQHPTVSSTSLDEFKKRYIGCIIVPPDCPQKDWNGTNMSCILAIRDKVSHWTVLRPISCVTRDAIRMEILTVLTIKRLPRGFEESAVATAVSVFTDDMIDKHNKQLQTEQIIEAETQKMENDELEKRYLEDQVLHTLLDLQRTTSSNWVMLLHEIMWKLNYNSFKYVNRKAESIGTSENISSTTQGNVQLTDSQTICNNSDTDRLGLATMTCDTTSINVTTPTKMTGAKEVANGDDEPNYRNTSSLPDDMQEPSVITQATCKSSSEKSIWDAMFNVDTTNGNEYNQDVDQPNPYTISEPSRPLDISQLDDLLDDQRLVNESKRLLETEHYDIRSFFDTDGNRFEDFVDDVQIVNPESVPNTAPTQRYNPQYYNLYSVKDAFSCGKTIMVSIDDVEYRLCQPSLKCEKCNMSGISPIITFADDPYYDLMKNPDRWFFPDIVSTFGFLLSHAAHRDDMIYIDSTLPDESTIPTNAKAVPLSREVNDIVAVAFDKEHFAVLRFSRSTKFAHVYDGLRRPIKSWHAHVLHILQLYGIPKEGWQMTCNRELDRIDGVNIRQNDSNSCGPIACMVMWKLFFPHDVNLQEIPQDQYRELSIEKLRQLLQKYEGDCILSKKKRRDIEHEDTTATIDNRVPDIHTPNAITDTDHHPTAVTVDGQVAPMSKYARPDGQVVTISENSRADKPPIPTQVDTKSSDKKRKPLKIAETKNVQGSIDSFFPKVVTTHSKTGTNKKQQQKQQRDKRKQTNVRSIDKNEKAQPPSKKLKPVTKKEKTIDVVRTSKKTKPIEEKKQKTKKSNSRSVPVSKIESSPKSNDTTSPSPQKKRKLVYDGLSDSDTDSTTSSDKRDDEFMECVTIERTSRKSKRKIPRIKIKVPQGGKTPERKCQCKRGCNHLCGCKRNNRMCDISCACKAECDNT